MKKNPLTKREFSACESIIKPQEIKYIKLFNNELMWCGVCKIIYIKNYH
jgi:hypothetical protein